MLLSIKDLHTYYGNIHALHGLSMHVDEGEIVTLIGSNGAGKTTTLSSIVGLVPPKSGEIMFDGKNITSLPTHEICNMGISMAPEGREIFPDMTVYENLRLGMYSEKDVKKIKDRVDKVFEIFPRLKDRVKQVASTLSGGEQQMLTIGRALMSDPKIMLLDEPSLGLAPNLVELIFKVIVDINKQGVTILLVEQNANMALQVANRGYVLETGSIILEGTGKELAKNSVVKKAYLGA
jgi:branched-chain amino acid transport system ATP-binding protein